jgi:hypothetical protein
MMLRTVLITTLVGAAVTMPTPANNDVENGRPGGVPHYEDVVTVEEGQRVKRAGFTFGRGHIDHHGKEADDVFTDRLTQPRSERDSSTASKGDAMTGERQGNGGQMRSSRDSGEQCRRSS